MCLGGVELIQATKINKNIFWLLFDKFVRLTFGFFIGIWIARYLGPDSFGTLSFGIAFVALFTFMSSLGLKDIVVRMLVSENNTLKRKKIIATSLYMQLIGGVLAIITINTSAYFFYSEDSLVREMLFIISLTMLLKISDVSIYWFESQVESRIVVISHIIGLVLTSAMRIIAIIYGESLIFFVYFVLIESAISSFLLLFLLAKKGLLNLSIPNLSLGKKIFNQSWPLMVTVFSIAIYMKIDQVMLGSLLNAKEVGIYNAASRLSEIWYFIPGIIITSIYPSLIRSFEKDMQDYLDSIKKVLQILFIFSLLLSVVISIFAESIILTLYGQQFLGSAKVLMVHIWSSIFVFLGVAGNNWFILNKQNHQIMYRTLIGLSINIVLNYFLIPVYGAFGAALAILIAQLFSSFLADGFFKSSREIFFLKLRCFYFSNLDAFIKK